MTATNRLNLLLSEILQNDSSSKKRNSHESINQPTSSLTFAEHDYPSSVKTPLPPRRNGSSLRNHRQRHPIHQSNGDNSQQTPPLLNSSTLDDLFRALTLECEQYLADSSTPSYQNKTYGQLIVQPPIISTHIDSNDDDYENLHSTKFPLSNGISPLKTSIEVMSPEKRQVISVSVSSKRCSSPNVSSSRTYPLLSTSILSSTNCHSSEDDSIDISSSSTHRKRRRRPRKQQIISSTIQSSSSDNERTETIEKKPIVSKRSYSTDHRQQRIYSIYDNHPISTTIPKIPIRRPRRRDISLQQHLPISTRHEDITSRFQENLCSPLSVLLTSTQSTSDFVDHSQQRRSRLELGNQQPLSLLDRMHQQFYRTPSAHDHHNIPTHRVPSYPVY